MPVRKLTEYLDSNGVAYDTIEHSPAMTAQHAAGRAHIAGREVAKTVMVRLDARLAMAVVAAPDLVSPGKLGRAARVQSVEIAGEEDFGGRFPECELGAMPPFGNLWGLDVYADERLREDDRIAFAGGTHSELVQIPWRDFERLVAPRVAPIATREA
jgi:Ala-tRNA(Pro) deacylase